MGMSFSFWASSNRFWRGSEVMDSADSLLFWCDEQNRQPVSISNGWWYYVQRNVESGLHYVQKLEGGLGEEMQRYASGRWKPDFSNWDQASLNRHEAKLRGFLHKGRAPVQREMM